MSCGRSVLSGFEEEGGTMPEEPLCRIFCNRGCDVEEGCSYRPLSKNFATNLFSLKIWLAILALVASYRNLREIHLTLVRRYRRICKQLFTWL